MTHEIRLPQTLGHTVQLVRRGARNRKVLGGCYAPDAARVLVRRRDPAKAGDDSRVHGRDERPRGWVERRGGGEARDDGLEEVGSESGGREVVGSTISA